MASFRELFLEALTSLLLKLKAKGREKSHRFNFFLVEGLIVAYRYVLCKSGNRKMQLTFILTCFAKYVFLADFFVVTNQANYQDYSGIYTEVGIASAEAILELHGSFI